MNRDLLLITKDDCHACHVLKNIFERNNIKYTEMNVSSANLEKKNWILRKLRTFPTVYKNSYIVLRGLPQIKGTNEPDIDKILEVIRK